MTPERRAELLASAQEKQAAARRAISTNDQLKAYCNEHGLMLTYSLTVEEYRAMWEPEEHR